MLSDMVTNREIPIINAEKKEVTLRQGNCHK